MSRHSFTRRAVIAACAAFALAGRAALSQSGQAVRNIRVDVAPLRANAGDPTATWVEQELPRRLAQALAGGLTPNTGAIIHGGSSPDNIIGVATIGSVQWPVRATTSYAASPIDQTMIEQSNPYRVSQLVQALTFWIARDLGA
jgi:hypothetical protein